MLMFPSVDNDTLLDWYRLKKVYTWLDADTYYTITQELSKYPNLTVDEICALVQYESGNYCNNNLECMKKVRSYAGAIGLLQVMPFHHKGPAYELTNTKLNLMYGIRYYYWCLQYAKGDKSQALRYYNAGPFSSASTYKGWNSYVRPILATTKKSSHLSNDYAVIQ